VGEGEGEGIVAEGGEEGSPLFPPQSPPQLLPQPQQDPPGHPAGRDPQVTVLPEPPDLLLPHLPQQGGEGGVLGGEGDPAPAHLHGIDVGVHVRVELGAVLHVLYPQRPADGLHPLGGGTGGGGEAQHQGMGALREVPLGHQRVGVVLHRPVALVEDQEEEVPQAQPPPLQIVPHHLGGGEEDPALPPGPPPLLRIHPPRQHPELLREEADGGDEAPGVLDHQGAGGGHHQHPPGAVTVEEVDRQQREDHRLPQAGGEDHQRVPLRGLPHDLLLVPPVPEDPGTEQGMLEKLPQPLLHLPSLLSSHSSSGSPSPLSSL
jgi:hypothetical protein